MNRQLNQNTHRVVQAHQDASKHRGRDQRAYPSVQEQEHHQLTAHTPQHTCVWLLLLLSFCDCELLVLRAKRQGKHTLIWPSPHQSHQHVCAAKDKLKTALQSRPTSKRSAIEQLLAQRQGNGGGGQHEGTHICEQAWQGSRVRINSDLHITHRLVHTRRITSVFASPSILNSTPSYNTHSPSQIRWSGLSSAFELLEPEALRVPADPIFEGVEPPSALSAD